MSSRTALSTPISPNNLYGVSDPEMDKLTEAQQREFDRAKREQIGAQIVKRELDQVYRIWGISSLGKDFKRPYVQNYVSHAVTFSPTPGLISISRHLVGQVRMNMYPERYDYVPLPKRPRLELPNGNRIAVWVAPNVEFYEYQPPERKFGNPWPRTGAPERPSLRSSRLWESQSNWRCFNLMDKYNIRGTVSLNIYAVFDHFPEIAQAMVDRDWDYMSHAIYNTRNLHGMEEEGTSTDR